MPIEIACTSCNKRLRVPDNAAGKRVRCPQCKAVINVPGAGGSSAGSQGRFHLKTEDGQTFGPVPKRELDEWMAEGRITAECQLLREGADQWQWASDIYPQLEEGATATQSSPATGGAAAGPDPNNPFAFAAQDSSPTARIGGAPRSGGGGGKAYGRDPAIVSKVQIPAILLMVAGGIGVLMHLLGLFANLMGMGVGAANNDLGAAMSGTAALVGTFIGFGIDGLVIYGGLQMKSLRSWGLALTASIFAMLPCISCGCLLGLPIGIWSIVVLCNADVKSAFR